MLRSGAKFSVPRQTSLNQLLSLAPSPGQSTLLASTAPRHTIKNPKKKEDTKKTEYFLLVRIPFSFHHITQPRCYFFFSGLVWLLRTSKTPTTCHATDRGRGILRNLARICLSHHPL